MRSFGIPVLRSLPVTLPIGLATFGIISMVLLILNQFCLSLLLGIGLPVTVVVIYLTYWLVTRPGSERADQSLLFDVLAILGILLWAGLNLPLSAQHILTDRDPATYAVTGAWLTTHHDLHIPKPAGVSSLPTMTANSLGFNTSRLHPGEIYSQGAHLLPALLGVAGKLFGQTAMLHFNVLFGAVALLAFYGFTRRALKPRWSLLATAALAVSLPFIFFSRDTYTEPLTLMVIFSSLTLLMYGIHTKRALLWMLAGFCTGASTLLRIDSYVFLAALEAFCLWYLLVADPRERPARFARVVALAIPAAIVAVLGWLDVAWLSSGYYHDLHPQIVAQFYFIGALTVLGLASVIVAWKTTLLERGRRLVAGKRFIAGVQLLLGLFFVGLTARAVWFFGMAVMGHAQVIPVIEYARNTTITWLLWYIGPLLGVTGIIGFIYGWSRLLRGRMGWMVPFFAVLTAACILYLLDPQISADQVYASRRFLPVIFPGFIVLGVMVVQQAVQRLERYAAHPGLFKGLVTLVVTVALLGPGLTSLPFWAMRPYTQLALIGSLCHELPKNALVVWVGQEGAFATQPTQAFCGVTSLSTTVQGPPLHPLAKQLAAISSKTGQAPYFAAAGSDAKLLAGFGTLETTKVQAYVEPEHTYKKFPVRIISHTQSFVLVPLTPVTSKSSR